MIGWRRCGVQMSRMLHQPPALSLVPLLIQWRSRVRTHWVFVSAHCARFLSCWGILASSFSRIWPYGAPKPRHMSHLGDAAF
mmetsp:Transcript_36423/g.95691  ORF Transcript_36423/g.95691 Transcript_36423/m.95691 type:complete len:82 (+) Transcript_36423:380-625(+)